MQFGGPGYRVGAGGGCELDEPALDATDETSPPPTLSDRPSGWTDDVLQSLKIVAPMTMAAMPGANCVPVAMTSPSTSDATPLTNAC